MSRIHLVLLVLIATLALSSGCTEPIPAGHVGMAWESEGFHKEVLAPGRHDCWGRCKMYLMEVTDKTFKMPMSVTCADELEFNFVVSLLVAVDKTNNEAILDAFSNLTPTGHVPDTAGSDTVGLISIEQLFETYVQRPAEQEARKAAAKYETREIIKKRAQVIEDIITAVRGSTVGSIVKVKQVNVGSLDFDPQIKKAQQLKVQKQIEIETERADALKRVAKSEGDLKVAHVEYKKELVEAAMIADANRVIGASITPQYLAYKQLEVIKKAASGPNNWGFVPYTDQVNGLDYTKWTTTQGVLDIELLKRIQDAKAAVQDMETEEDGEPKKVEKEPAPPGRPAPTPPAPAQP